MKNIITYLLSNLRLKNSSMLLVCKLNLDAIHHLKY